MCTGRSLGLQAKRVFFCFQLGVFTHNNNGNKNKRRRRCGGVYGFDVFMSFFFIWDVCTTMDIVGRWLIMWQGSYQVKCGRWKSHCGMEER
jgi:hypothetical protein